ncbi:hypothetical protein BDK51DRAFT_42016 [Blyttiomyces helicus]|uniref:MYND-type domain-containing protein n=1 Tax=Blyttiomyces helicus TaxID=388810 RepID=A0A4P9WG78_9FUNG|nr:hypothetical protein BDK51DRAFT_42016 [Blyttiomyces helicus]|eukprot:RKO90030.1 hypothetical protein BDK51DRAFT_42016 [Blyttiomyces helicus]
MSTPARLIPKLRAGEKCVKCGAIPHSVGTLSQMPHRSVLLAGFSQDSHRAHWGEEKGSARRAGHQVHGLPKRPPPDAGAPFHELPKRPPLTARAQSHELPKRPQPNTRARSHNLPNRQHGNDLFDQAVVRGEGILRSELPRGCLITSTHVPARCFALLHSLWAADGMLVGVPLHIAKKCKPRIALPGRPFERAPASFASHPAFPQLPRIRPYLTPQTPDPSRVVFLPSPRRELSLTKVRQLWCRCPAGEPLFRLDGQGMLLAPSSDAVHMSLVHVACHQSISYIGLMKSADGEARSLEDDRQQLASCIDCRRTVGFGDAAQRGGGVNASVQGRWAEPALLPRRQTPAMSPATCSNCRGIAAPDTTFKTCARCRSSRYCCPECQRTDWRLHKPICDRFAANAAYAKTHDGERVKFKFEPCESGGMRAILFDHVFGGVFSLLQMDGIRRHGPGMVLCKLSCASAEFSSPKDAGRAVHRRIRSTYVPAAGLAALDERWCKVETHVATLESFLGTPDMFKPANAKCFGQMFFLVVASPSDPVRKFDLYLMMNWLPIDRVPRGAINTEIFEDWD